MQADGPECHQPLIRQKTILLVEDHELNVKLIKDVLEYKGYKVIVSGLGAPTLDLARKHRPDLILLDIQLPDIPGTEAARQLKADDQTWRIPIIAVTAFALKGDDAAFLASGFDAYVAKPFNVREFVRKIGDLLSDTNPAATPFVLRQVRTGSAPDQPDDARVSAS